jgi:hypothetical protein
MGTITSLDDVIALLSGVVVTGNQSPANTHTRDAMNAFSIPTVWAAVLKSTNHNPTSNADVTTPLPPNPTLANVQAHMATPGWSAIKLATSIDSDYLISNPAALTELLSLKTIALVNGSTTTYAFTSTPVFSSIWDLFWQFKAAYSTAGGVYTAPTVASGFLDITDPSRAWKQVSNGPSGIISDADIGRALHLFYVNAQSDLPTFMSYITSSSTPATPIAHSLTILNLGGAAAAATNVATLAATPAIATLATANATLAAANAALAIATTNNNNALVALTTAQSNDAAAQTALTAAQALPVNPTNAVTLAAAQATKTATAAALTAAQTAQVATNAALNTPTTGAAALQVAAQGAQSTAALNAGVLGAAGTPVNNLALAKASAPYIASTELAALDHYKAICVFHTISNYFDAGYPWEHLIFTNTLLSSIKVKYNINANSVYQFVGPSGLNVDGTGVAVPKRNAVAAVTASPGVAGVAALPAVTSTAESQIPSIRTKAQIADGLSLSYLAFYVLNAMTYSGLDCVATLTGIRLNVVASSAHANDFDLIFNGFLGSYSLLDRLSLLLTANGQTTSNILLKGTDSADSIANVWNANNGASKRFITALALTQTSSIAYTSVSTPLLVLAAIRNNVVAWSGSNSKLSSTFGTSGFTHNSYIPSGSTYTSSVIADYAALYYINNVSGVASVISRGVVAPFNNLSNPSFTPNNSNLMIQALTNNTSSTILLIQVSAESASRLQAGNASNLNAQSFLDSLSNNSATTGYTYNDILDYPASPAFNNKRAVQVAMEGVLTNPSELHTIVSYAKDSAQRLANVRLGFAGLTAFDKNRFVSIACKLSLPPADLFMLISSNDLENAQTLYNTMDADTGATVPTVAAYKQYLTYFSFTIIKEVFVDGINSNNTPYPVLGNFSSNLPPGEIQTVASASPVDEWFIAFNSAAGIADLKSVGALPQQLFTWTRDIKVFDPVSGILTTPVDAPKALVFKLALVKQVYGLSDSEVSDALEAAGITSK